MKTPRIFAIATACMVVASMGSTGRAKPSSRRRGKGHRMKLARAAMDRVMRKVDRALTQKGGRPSYGLSRRLAVKKAHGKDDKTLAPYFHTPGSNERGIEQLPLKSTSADVKIAGVIAKVRVTQVYKNKGRKPIEAVYVFPGSTRAAVHAMRMKVGKRVIEAEIKERKAARKAYNQAKQQGKRASLLEQQRPNVFTMNVANIMPGDEITVELDYSELLVPEDGVYEFVYPTVVGPRFGGGANPKTDKWISNPYLRQGQKETYKFGLDLHLESPIGIKDISSPSHKINISYGSKSSADVKLARSGGGNRDFVLKYRLAGNKIEAGVMTYRKGGESFFLVMMEPPKRVRKSQVPPREYIFVLDVSGSMYGFPLNTAKALMQKLLKDLRRQDYFNVVLFAGRSHIMHPRSVRATEGNIQRAINVINRRRGGGGTQLLAALKNAYGIKRPRRRISRSVIVVTDGYVGVETQTFRYIRKNLGKVNCFAFGIGSSVNRGLIEGMARAGMGEPFVVLRPSESTGAAEKFRKYIESPVLSEIKLAFNGVRVHDVVPKRPPDLMAKRPLIVFGKYAGRSTGKISITGHTGKGRFKKSLAIRSPKGEKSSALRVLWARKWAEMLMDQLAMLPGNTDITQAVTSLGLTYKLLTRFTSFVAVDKVKVRKGGKLVTVKQPLPLPKGVSNYAVGGKAGRRRYRAAPMKSYGRPAAAPLGRPRPRSSSRRRGYSGPLHGLSAGSSADSEARKEASAEPDTEKKKRKVRVRVFSIRYAKSGQQARVKALIGRKLAGSGCLAYALKKTSRKSAVVKISISNKGKVSVSGGNAVLRACLRATLARLARKLTRGGLVSGSHRALIVKLRLKLR
jgi:Ca-activated chloride channel family protein